MNFFLELVCTSCRYAVLTILYREPLPMLPSGPRLNTHLAGMQIYKIFSTFPTYKQRY